MKNYHDNSFDINDDYFSDILLFAEFHKTNQSLDFHRYHFLLYIENGKFHKSLPQNLILGSTYSKNDLELLADVLQKKVLWEGYSERYNETEIVSFIEFCLNIGVKNTIEINRCRADDFPHHPLWWGKLRGGGKNTGLGINVDYKIENIEQLISMESIAVNRLIWETVTRYKTDSYWENMTIARYAPNASVTVKECESSLVYYLKNSKWIPNKNGEFCCPKDITQNDLRDDFVCDFSNGFLKAIGFGVGFTEIKNDIKKVLQAHNVDAKKEELLLKLAEKDPKQLKEALEAIERDETKQELKCKSLLEAVEEENTNRIDSFDDYAENRRAESYDDYVIKHRSETKQKRMARDEEAFLTALQTSAEINKSLNYTYVVSNKEEKNVVGRMYAARCQICDMRIRKAKGGYHYHAINIIKTTNLDKRYFATLKTGWNTLCLCPNCAAEYKYCSKNISGLVKELMNNPLPKSIDGFIEMEVMINEKIRMIKFVPEHLSSLKFALEQSLVDELMVGQ